MRTDFAHLTEFVPRTTANIFGIDDLLGALVGPILGIGAKAVGGAAKNSEDAATLAAQKGAIDRFTSLQGSEFDKRQAALGDSATRIGGLQDEGFKAGLDQQKASNDENFGITTDFSKRGRDIQQGGINQVGAIDTTRNAGVEDSQNRLYGVTQDERARQDKFKQDADGVIGTLLPQVGRAGFDDQQGKAYANRGALVARAISPSTINPTSSDPVVQAEMARQIGEGRNLAALTGDRTAGVSAYGDASARTGETLDRAKGATDALGLMSDTSFKALAPEQGAATMVGDIAKENADRRKADVATNVSSFLKTLSDEKDRTEKRVGDRQSGIADAINSLYSGGTKAEQDYIDSLLTSSGNYEDALRSATNFKVGGTIGQQSLVGSLANGVGDALLPSFTELFKSGKRAAAASTPAK